MDLLKVVVYPLIVLICCLLIVNDEKKYNNCSSKYRLSWNKTIIISGIIGIYSMSFNQTFWWADLVWYNRFFSAGEEFPDSVGLNIIYNILHLFTTNIDCLLATVAFLSSAIMLFSYNIYEEASSIALIMLFVTPFFIETCQVNLKQGIACGLISFALGYWINRKYIIAFLFAILATLFHITALPISVLTFSAIIIVRNSDIRLRKIIFICFLIVALCFRQLYQILLHFSYLVPALQEKLLEYAVDGSFKMKSTGLIAFKGLPYYLITILGFIKRKKYVNKVKNYDEYLVVSIIASVSYFLSFYSYWMSRIINYYLLIDFVFLGLLCKKNNKNKNSQIELSVIWIMMFILTFRLLIQIYIL